MAVCKHGIEANSCSFCIKMKTETMEAKLKKELELAAKQKSEKLKVK